MNSVHGMIAFLRGEADLAEARAKQLRLTAALIQANQEHHPAEPRKKRKKGDPIRGAFTGAIGDANSTYARSGVPAAEARSEQNQEQEGEDDDQNRAVSMAAAAAAAVAAVRAASGAAGARRQRLHSQGLGYDEGEEEDDEDENSGGGGDDDENAESLDADDGDEDWANRKRPAASKRSGAQASV